MTPIDTHTHKPGYGYCVGEGAGGGKITHGLPVTSKAGHKCTRGSPGSIPTGIFGPQVSTRILVGMFSRVLTPTSQVLTGDRSPSSHHQHYRHHDNHHHSPPPSPNEQSGGNGEKDQERGRRRTPAFFSFFNSLIILW